MVTKEKMIKVFLGGLLTMLITFTTAFIPLATETVGNGGDISDIKILSWLIMLAGALGAGFVQWKSFMTQPPEN